MKNITIFSLFLLFLSSCAKYKTQFEGPYSDAENVIADRYEIMVVQNGKIKLHDRTKEMLKTVLTDELVTKAAFNYAHDKIAYQGGGNIKIIDIDGNLIAAIPNTEDVKCFEWHANNETLYYLQSNDKIAYYGPDIPIANIFMSVIFPANSTEREVTSIGICPDGTVIAGLRYRTNNNSLRNAVFFDYTAGSGKEDYSFEDLGYESITNIKIDTAGNHYSYVSVDNNSSLDYVFVGVVDELHATQRSSKAMCAIAPSGNSIAVYLKNSKMMLVRGFNAASSGEDEYDVLIEGDPITDLDW